MPVRHVQLEILARHEGQAATRAEGERLHRRCELGARFQDQLHGGAHREREREREQVADEQRALLTQADRTQIDGPPGEHADERSDRELLPAARRHGQRLGQHEGAEEEEGR